MTHLRRTFLIGYDPGGNGSASHSDRWDHKNFEHTHRLGDLTVSWSGAGELLEANGSAIFLHGQLISGKRLAMADLARRYQQDGLAALDQVLSNTPDGVFLFVFNPNSSTAYAWRDKQGLGSAYYRCAHGSFSVSNKLGPLRAQLASPSLNHEQVRRQLNSRYQPDSAVLLNGIHQLTAGERCQIVNGDELTTHRYWELGRLRPRGMTVDQHADEVDHALDKYFASLASRIDTVCIPLSGGVDSSLLLAKAHQHFSRCIAATAYFEGDSNPELESAKAFAAHLGVEHVLVSVADDEVLDRYKSVCAKLERPPRRVSAIALDKLVETMEKMGSLIVFGEPADLLYGSWAIKRVRTRASKLRTLHRFGLTAPVGRIVGSLPLRKLQRLGRFAGLNLLDILRAEQLVDFEPEAAELLRSDRAHHCVSEIEQEWALDEVGLRRAGTRDVWELTRNYFFRLGIVDQFQTITKLLTKDDVFVSVPFLDNGVLEASYGISQEAYFGGQFVKQVLRKLGERHFPAEYVHRPKWGFVTPQRRWIRDIIAPEFDHVDLPAWKSRHDLDSVIPFDELPTDDFELMTSLLSLMTVVDQFELPDSSARLAAH